MRSAFLSGRALAILLVCGVGVVGGGAACRGKPEIAFDVTLPGTVEAQTTWIEVGAFKNASCDAVRPMLASGISDSATARVAFKRADVAPRFGDLPRAPYAFGAVARREDCGVIATGCVQADVADTDHVTVTMTASDAPTGACSAGASCQAARCVPANDNANPSVGAGCSLELVGAGPLANPVAGEGTLISAPAVATTKGGFTIAYREVDPSGSTARVTILPVDIGGGALPPQRPALPGRCAASNETDGVGMAVQGDNGMIALARAQCDTPPALELLNFTPGPTIGAFIVSSSQNESRLTLSHARAAAPRLGGGVVVFHEAGVGRVATMERDRGIVMPSGTFGGTGVTGMWVGTSDRVMALLSAGPRQKQTAPAPDGGAGDAGVDPFPTVDGGANSSLRLLVVPVETPLDQFDATASQPRAPIEFPGEWGSVAARGTRVIVVSDSVGVSRSVAYRAFDLNRDAPAETSGFSTEGLGKATNADVVIQGDRVFFAVLKPGGISLAAYDNASTTPTPLRQVTFNSEPRIPAVANVRDGRVAIAATDSRVAVVWTTAKVLGRNDVTGGYAIFACTP